MPTLLNMAMSILASSRVQQENKTVNAVDIAPALHVFVEAREWLRPALAWAGCLQTRGMLLACL